MIDTKRNGIKKNKEEEYGLYTNEVGCEKQQKSRANDTNEYGQLVKGLRRCPLTAETRVRFPYLLSAESS